MAGDEQEPETRLREDHGVQRGDRVPPQILLLRLHRPHRKHLLPVPHGRIRRGGPPPRHQVHRRLPDGKPDGVHPGGEGDLKARLHPRDLDTGDVPDPSDLRPGEGVHIEPGHLP